MSVLLLSLGVTALLGLAAWWTAQSLLAQSALAEGRAVADMAENVGRWASQYGGVHVRTEGVQGKLPGSFLTRSAYGATGPQDGPLQGHAVTMDVASERALMARLETYYWKNPALVQREVADVVTSSGARVRWRMTARSVLNPNNRPGPFEIEALDDLQARPVPAGGAAPADLAATEYWRVDAGQMRYARSIVAQASCLKCHDNAANAPDFLKNNTLFNGGGGFGYRVGQPIGLISVTVPMVDSGMGLLRGIPPQAWGALAAALLAGVALVVTLSRRA